MTRRAGAGSVAARRPYPVFGGITLFSSEIGDTYNSLQAKISGRLNHGLTYLAAYTWSKFLQSNPSPSLGGNNGYEKSISQFNIPQNFAFSMSYELPFGTGKRYLTQCERMGQWRLGRMADPEHYGSAQRPALHADHLARRSQHRGRLAAPHSDRQRNAAASAPSTTGSIRRTLCCPAQYTYGTSKAFILQGDMYRQYDVSSFKVFPHHRRIAGLNFAPNFSTFLMSPASTRRLWLRTPQPRRARRSILPPEAKF